MKGNHMMTSQSQSQAQNAGKGYRLEPIYFFNKEPWSFENLSFFLIEAFRGIKDLQIGVWSSQLQCYKATSSSRMSLPHSRDLRGGCPSHPFPFRCGGSQNPSPKRNL